MTGTGRLGAALAAVLSLSLAAAPAMGTPVILRASVYPKEKGTTVQRSFLGISTDWNSVGKTMFAAAPIWSRLMLSLGASGAGVPTLRVGGQYQDNAWWNPTMSASRNPVLSVNLTPTLLNGLATDARLTGQRMIVGVNLGANDPSIATAEVRAALRYIPRRSIISFDIGNEPDFYKTTVAWSEYKNGHQVLHRFRPRSFNGRTYLRQFGRIVRALQRVSRNLPLSGMSGYAAMVSAANFLRREHGNLVIYTEHTYAGSTCNTQGVPYRPGDPHYPTAAKLLGPWTYATTAETRLAIAAARPYRLPVRIDEMNSLACAGAPNITNTMTAGLWALDQFFLDALGGVQGIDFHIDNPYETPIYLINSGTQASAYVGPLYYAMLAFAQTVGNRGALLLRPTALERVARGVNARMWAIRSRGGGYRFAVINKSLRRSGLVMIKIPHGRSTGTLMRYVAPNISAYFGVSFAGQATGQTGDGSLPGHRVVETVRPRGGTYTFYLPKASAAVLIVS